MLSDRFLRWTSAPFGSTKDKAVGFWQGGRGPQSQREGSLVQVENTIKVVKALGNSAAISGYTIPEDERLAEKKTAHLQGCDLKLGTYPFHHHFSPQTYHTKCKEEVGVSLLMVHAMC
jgi:hypothetical protein